MTTKYDLVLPYVIQHDYVRLQNMLDTDKEGMVKLRDHKGRTLLHVMAALGDLEGMRLLLRYRAPVDARDDDGKTPLYYAVDRGHMPCVRALVKRGAVVNPPGDTSPFRCCIEHALRRVSERRLEILLFLAQSATRQRLREAKS